MAIDTVSSVSSSKAPPPSTKKAQANPKDTGFGTSAGTLNPNNTRDGSMTANEARPDIR